MAQAMDREMKAVYGNGTWKHTTLLPGKRALPLKWVYKVKKDSCGMVQQLKARIVVKGFLQRFGEDYCDTYAPSACPETIRIMLLLAGKLWYIASHWDTKNAFVHRKVEEEILVELAKGYESGNHVGRLLKSLYGLLGLGTKLLRMNC